MARSADFNSFLTRIAEAAGLSDASFVSIVTNCDRVIALVRAGRAAEASQTPATGAMEPSKAAIIPEPPAQAPKARPSMAALHEASAKNFERNHQAPRGKASGIGWSRIQSAIEIELAKTKR
jgi:hypothetical protein